MKAQTFIDPGCENGGFQRGCRHGRCKENALEQMRQEAEIRTYFLPQSRRGKPVGALTDQFFRTGDVSADRRQTAAGVLDEGPDDQVCAKVRRFRSGTSR